MTAEAECALWELPVSMCACPKHRGGTAPAEEPIATVGQPLEARFDGPCEGCERGVREGQMIARVADSTGYIHSPRCPR